MRGNENDGSSLDLNRTVGIIKVQNFVFLAFALCTKSVYNEDECKDNEKEKFLKWVYYGNLVIFIIILLGVGISKIPTLVLFLNKCGAVFVTLQTCLFQGTLIIFHFVFMVYSIQQHFLSSSSSCKELQLFIMVYAYVSIVWIFLQIYQFLLRIIFRIIHKPSDYYLDNQPNSYNH